MGSQGLGHDWATEGTRFEFPEYHVAMDLGVKSEPVEVQLHFSRNLCQSHAVTEGETPQLWKRLVVGRETL